MTPFLSSKKSKFQSSSRPWQLFFYDGNRGRLCMMWFHHMLRIRAIYVSVFPWASSCSLCKKRSSSECLSGIHLRHYHWESWYISLYCWKNGTCSFNWESLSFSTSSNLYLRCIFASLRLQYTHVFIYPKKIGRAFRPLWCDTRKIKYSDSQLTASYSQFSGVAFTAQFTGCKWLSPRYTRHSLSIFSHLPKYPSSKRQSKPEGYHAACVQYVAPS